MKTGITAIQELLSEYDVVYTVQYMIRPWMFLIESMGAMCHETFESDSEKGMTVSNKATVARISWFSCIRIYSLQDEIGTILDAMVPECITGGIIWRALKEMIKNSGMCTDG